jgi:hypothetical protein
MNRSGMSFTNEPVHMDSVFAVFGLQMLLNKVRVVY